MFKFLLSLAALAGSSAAYAANEDWWFAESDHFRIYSAGGETEARKIATRLERLDQAMRIYTGTKAKDDAPTPSVAKPTLYQFGTNDDIGDLAGQRGVYGFFIPRRGDSVAFMPLKTEVKRDRSGSMGTRDYYEFNENNIDAQSVIQHEYTHYFMFQHAPAAYPSWYIEGLAELFGMMRIEDNRFFVGDPPPHRENEIAVEAFDADKVFRPMGVTGPGYPLYGHGWLLTSYLSFEPTRSGQLSKYLKAVNSGTDSMKAAKDAFGDLGKLTKELNSYRLQRSLGLMLPFPDNTAPKVEVRRLAADEAARMELMIRSDAGVDKAMARKQVNPARALVERFPQSVPALMAAIEVEYDAGNYEQANILSKRVLALAPNSAPAHLRAAEIAMKFAENDPVWVKTARTHFLRANKLDNDDPNALIGYYVTFPLAGETPTPAALNALDAAYDFAPFDTDTRYLLAHRFLLENKDEVAFGLLGPIINSPHKAKSLTKMRDLVAKARAGDRQPLIDKLAPKLKPEKEDRA